MDARTGSIEVFDQTGSAELLGTLTHRPQTDSGHSACVLEANTVVADFDLQRISHTREANYSAVCLRVADHVHERLVDDSISRDLQSRRKRGEFAVDGHDDLRPGIAGREVGHAVADGSDKSQLVESRWAQVVRHAADVARRLADRRVQIANCLLRLRRISRDQPVNRRGHEAKAGERGRKLVMQISAEPAPLFFSRQHQSLAREA